MYVVLIDYDLTNIRVNANKFRGQKFTKFPFIKICIYTCKYGIN